jgi:hypothetical protein
VSTRWTEDDLMAHNARMNRHASTSTDNTATAAPKPSKYRNVRTMSPDGQVFDSKREADYWQTLKARETAGEIKGLMRQVAFGLWCPVLNDSADNRQVSEYRADFVFWLSSQDECEPPHVVDAKGKRTQMYQLKKKWLELQSGIVIEEV